MLHLQMLRRLVTPTGLQMKRTSSSGDRSLQPVAALCKRLAQ
jgi:hypothetical protein